MSVTELLEFKAMIGAREAGRKPDRQTRQLLLYLFTGTRGGFTRLRIIALLMGKPYNTHQLAREMDLDYKAVQHHMRVLEKNSLVSKTGAKYGAVFVPSNLLEANIAALNEAIDKLARKMNSKKVYL